MFIIWKGYGNLVFLFLGLSFLVSVLLFNNQSNPLMYLAILFLCNALSTFLLYRYSQQKKPRVVQEKVTGRMLTIKQSHSLYFIPIQYWVVIFLILSAFFFAVSLLEK